ncbi:MAG TPA: OsmC family peroxiredoxin [Chitinophagales bacterium]|nr:OsmC family peroxiredoxin [Chitinophagales bacterium]
MNDHGKATWEGGLKEGIGTVRTEGPALTGRYNFASRFGEDNTGTNPEELVGAAHAACFSMFLAATLEKDGHPPIEINTKTTVLLSRDETGPFIKKIEIETEGEVPDIEQADFERYAGIAKKNCPISRALASVPEWTLKATLKQ